MGHHALFSMLIRDPGLSALGSGLWVWALASNFENPSPESRVRSPESWTRFADETLRLSREPSHPLRGSAERKFPTSGRDEVAI